MTTVTEAVKYIVEEMMRSAYIVSPRFDDYKIVDVMNTGGIEGLDETLESIIADMIETHAPVSDSPEGFAGDLLNAETQNGLTQAQGVGLARRGLSTAQNPASIVAEGLQYLPHTALVAFAVSLAPFVFEHITRPGGPLDTRFKRYLEDEQNAFLSRQTQKDTEIGVRQVIVQAKRGFTASNGLNHFNSQKGIREGGIDKERLDRLGLEDHSRILF